ncbi:hypothetical protein LTR53_016050 [Teratosphaeriaceae sp. CCFEE 6253]|nr:hypothetical protein LTR53_016050 [Teratosphaeriaceae sp. CCFEE 6253]
MAGKVQINSATSAQNPTTQSQISTALLSNGGIKRIQETLQQRLDEDGWSQALREYTIKLFRSGEATTYDEALNKVMAKIRASGGSDGVDLRVPESAKVGGAEAVKRELERVCVVGEK